MINVKELRQKYPNPRKASLVESYADDYCVGGALSLCTGHGTGFPDEDQLTLLIVQHSSRDLDHLEAYRYAAQIIAANDAGDFDQAWRLLGLALTVPRQRLSEILKGGTDEGTA